MNWFEAFSILDEQIKAMNEDELIDAWRLFLTGFHTHIWVNPPTGDGVLVGEAQKNARHFGETVGALFDDAGAGVERLLFRLVMANEALVSCLDGPLVLATAPAGIEQVVMDEVWQPAYCDDCGGVLHPVYGRCVYCEASFFADSGR